MVAAATSASSRLDGAELISPTTRLQVFGVWEVPVSLLNSFLFVLIGLQLPRSWTRSRRAARGDLVLYAAAVSRRGDPHADRLACRSSLPAALPVPARYASATRTRLRQVPARGGWNGMRGAVSLAAALALPLTTDAGQPFPQRDLIVFLTFSVSS